MLWLSRKAPQELQEAAFQEKPVGSPSLPSGSPPLFLRLRSSTFFVTFSVALGILTDLCCYGLVVPGTHAAQTEEAEAREREADERVGARSGSLPPAGAGVRRDWIQDGLACSGVRGGADRL